MQGRLDTVAIVRSGTGGWVAAAALARTPPADCIPVPRAAIKDPETC